MSNTDINEVDLLIEIFLSHEPGSVEEYINLLADPPIRVTHKPTGISAIGEGQGSQVRNKEKALEFLKELLSSEGERINRY
jgi:protein subunit release factor A